MGREGSLMDLMNLGELIPGDWETLREEVNSFLLNKPKNTQISYKSDLTKFFKFLTLIHVHPLSCKQIHIEEYMKFVSLKGGKIINNEGTPAKDRTFNRKLASIKSFYNFLGEKRVIALDPSAFVSFRSMPFRVETNDLSNKNVAELLNLIPSDNFKHARDKALMATFFYTGLRKSEIQNLKVSDYKNYKDKKIFRVKVKGGYEKDIPVNPELVKHLEHYLKLAKKEDRELSPDSSLFVALNGNAVGISGEGIHKIFMKWVRKLRLGYKVSPHSARATFIGALSDMGVSLESSADIVGHKDPKMTKAYIKRRKELSESPVFEMRF
jgi:site-specific recombinase XerD